MTTTTVNIRLLRIPSDMFFLLKRHSDFILTLCLILIGVSIFFPGAMSGDSVDQWRQVNTPDQIGNWFPPTMVYLWILLNKITYGPQGMLIFHFTIYFLSIYIIGKVMISKLFFRFIYILSLGLFPPVFFLTGVIWKDTSLLIGISMSIALLLLFEKTQKNLFLICSLIFFIYGISTRHNGLVCSIPYSCYLIFLIIRHHNYRLHYYYYVPVIIILIFCFSITSTFFCNYKIKDIWKTYNFENSVFLWDLWGMSIEIGENIIPPYVFNEKSQNLGVEVLKKHYSNQSNSIIYLMQFLTIKRFKKDFPNAQFKKDFLKTIVKHPIAYLKIRGRLTLYMLGYQLPIDPFLFTPPKFDKKHYLYSYSRGLEFDNPTLVNATARLANFLFYNTPLWRVWLYIVLGIFQVIFLACFKPDMPNKRGLLLILSVGLIYWLPYPIISPATDFRFSNLTIFCSVLVLPFSAKSLFELLKGNERIQSLLSQVPRQSARPATSHLLRVSSSFVPTEAARASKVAASSASLANHQPSPNS